MRRRPWHKWLAVVLAGLIGVAGCGPAIPETDTGADTPPTATESPVPTATDPPTNTPVPPTATDAPSPVPPTLTPTDPPAANPVTLFTDPPEDVVSCATGAGTDDRAGDILAVGVQDNHGGDAVIPGVDPAHTGPVAMVRVAQSVSETVASDLSFAVLVNYAQPEGAPGALLYQIHDSVFTIGSVDATGRAAPGSEALIVVGVNGQDVYFLLPDGANFFFVETFHLAGPIPSSSARNCDRAPDEGAYSVP